LAELEKRLPGNLKGRVRDLRRNLKDFQKQIDKARAEREARLQRLADQVRRDVAKLLKQLEKAVRPPAKGKAARKKPTAKKSRRR
jgi:TolA-binding protein